MAGQQKHVSIFLFVVIVTVTANLPEGAPCTVDDNPGSCRIWKQCFNLALDIYDKNYPPLCSYDGPDPIICCTSCDLIDDVSKVVLYPKGGILWKTDQKSWNKCIDYSIDLPYEETIHTLGIFRKEWNASRECFQFFHGFVAAAGGRDASRAEFPHMALLGYGRTKEASQWLCGGSLLNERFVLTAGHCISTPAIGRVRYVALGMVKRSDPQDLWQIHNVLRIIPHPKYRPPSKYHDIALLQAARQISFNKNVLPTCLPNLAKPAEDNQASATGWGTMGPGTHLADNMQAVMLKKFSHVRCSALFQKHRHLVRGYSHDIQMCYGDEKEIKDTCEGDSGGPLQISGQAYRTQGTVIGVTSFGPECKSPGQAGVYTRVRPYVPWIDSIIW